MGVRAAKKQATRERVLAAARDLGYAGPDPLARSLRRGRCDVVAVSLEEATAELKTVTPEWYEVAKAFFG